MKQKILWIVAVVLSAIAWALHFRYFTSKDFSSTEKSLLWAVDTWATLLAIITVEVIMVYSLGTVAYYDLRPSV